MKWTKSKSRQKSSGNGGIGASNSAIFIARDNVLRFQTAGAFGSGCLISGGGGSPINYNTFAILESLPFHKKRSFAR